MEAHAHAHVCVCARAFMNVEAGTNTVSSSTTLYYFLKQGFSQNLEFIILPGLQAPGILMSLLPQN